MKSLLLSRRLNGNLLQGVLLSQDVEIGFEGDDMIMQRPGKTVVDLESVVFVLSIECR